ncbi:unnamed protein product [Durusdinium trenchii]|uniref:C3H1-type domain-containing protein n=1 Tax=Durusdinium trenchii TaxID=1381693 RepID=A0ABP0KWG8_9DINO
MLGGFSQIHRSIPFLAVPCLLQVRGEFATRGRSRWPTSLTSGVVVGVEVEEATIQAEVPEEQLTVGSIGHPVLCRRACVWFAKGMCSHSANCSYCHLPHHANITFDKRQWQQLQQMDLASLLAILLPSLRATLAAADLPREPAAQLLATVEAQAAPTALQHDRLRPVGVLDLASSAEACFSEPFGGCHCQRWCFANSSKNMSTIFVMR